MRTNPLVSLTKASSTAPVFAALVPVDGKGAIIPFILNPQSVGSVFSAVISEQQLFKGNSPSQWVGYKPDRHPIGGLTLSSGGCADITPLINALKASIKGDNVYNYVHGKRVIPSVRVVSGQITESQWLGGIPTEAEASLELMQVFSSPSVKVTVKSKMTEREIKEATETMVKGGIVASKIKIDAVKGIINVDGKLYANWIGGKLSLVKDATKAPTAPGKVDVKLPGGANPVKPSPTPPKFSDNTSEAVG
jgi:hypothetical protein